MRNKNTLVKDVQGTLIGIAIGQGLVAICSRGLSKESKVKLHVSGLIRSTIVGVANVAANEICRRAFNDKEEV